MKKWIKFNFLVFTAFLAVFVLSGCSNNSSIQQYNTGSNTVQNQTIPPDTSCSTGYYKNSDGNCIHVPSENPQGATAQCRDGSYSYSQHRQGTCSHHGGVAEWLY